MWRGTEREEVGNRRREMGGEGEGKERGEREREKPKGLGRLLRAEHVW